MLHIMIKVNYVLKIFPAFNLFDEKEHKIFKFLDLLNSKIDE